MQVFKDSRSLKRDARESLLGNLTTAVLSIFLYMLAASVLAEMIAGFNLGSPILSLILSVIIYFVINTCGNMLRIGLSYVFLRLQYRKGARIGDLFTAFRANSDAAVIVSAFVAILELFCMLPLIILLSLLSLEGRQSYLLLIIVLFTAGYAASFAVHIRYSMVPYLFLDFPQLTPEELLRGHKMRLFRLCLSFLPLHLLTAISFGVAGLWVSSYFHAAEAAFYKDLMENITF